MTKKNRPLPSPPGRRFAPGGVRPDDDSGGATLEERLAQAAAMGKLDAFMDEEFKDSEHARKLASMMMGMTGMPSPTAPLLRPEAPSGQQADEQSAPVSPPEDIVEAARGGNTAELMELLAREHQKRSGGKGAPVTRDKGTERQRAAEDSSAGETSTAFDRETLDMLVSLSREHGVSVDWLISRAIKLYIRDYKTSGRL